jgi:hypothetical protein
MIEIVIDNKDIEKALQRLDGDRNKLTQAVRDIVPVAARRVRRDVIEYLDRTVALAPKRGILVKRAVKALRHMDGQSRFSIASKRLLLDDYDINPRAVTAQKGVPVKSRKPFHYHLRKHGALYGSRSTLTGRMGAGSIPFIARTQSGNLRVMYRSANTGEHDTPLLVYAPSIQYHAVTPELEERERELGARIFGEELQKYFEGQT